MYRHFLFVIFFVQSSACLSQQKVLLIGTYHTTQRDRLNEIIPIAAAIERFHPEIICVEYPAATDTASVIQRSIMHRNEPQIFQKMEALRKAWKIPAGDMNAKIDSLQQDPALLSDIQKRMELQQLYFLSSDLGNAEYQGYLVMTSVEKDPEKATGLRGHSPGFETMKATYEHKRYRNDEYYRLVFPLAVKLNVSYLYAIDDLSSLKESEKPFNRLQVQDTTDVSKRKYWRHKQDFQLKLNSLPRDSNQWMFVNSLPVIQDLLNVEGYKIDEGTINEDIKLLQYYWVQRNRMMAHHVDEVAHKHPHQNIVVFFGASHVGPVREELNKLKSSYQVLTLSDVMR